MRSIFFAMFLGLGFSASANVIKGDQAQVKFEAMLAQLNSSPESIGMTESKYFGDDQHPELGYVKVTYLYEKRNANISCWENDYFQAGQIFYACSVK